MDSEIFSRHSHNLIVLALLLAAHDARAADPSAADRDRARSLMDEGYDLKDRGDHDAALRSFMAADEIMHVPTTSLAVAREQVATGKLVEAKATLITLVRMPIKGREPEPFTRARADAQTLLAELGPRLPMLKITVVGPNEGVLPELSVDYVVLPNAAWVQPIEVNPGRHHVAATAGSSIAEADVFAAEGESKSVTLRLRGSLLPTAEASAPSSSGADLSLTRIRPYLLWGGATLAGVGVVAGTISGIVSLSAASAAKRGCVANECPPATWADLDRARTTATIANVSFVVAGFGAIAGGLGFFLGNAARDPDAAAASARARIEPWFGASSAGVRGSF